MVTLVATPRLNGELKKTGRFFRVLKERVKATALDLRENFFLFFFTNWLMVDIKKTPKGPSHCTKAWVELQTKGRRLQPAAHDKPENKADNW